MFGLGDKDTGGSEQTELEKTQAIGHIDNAKKLKEEGNAFFKEGLYVKAIGKYSKIILYINSVAPLPPSRDAQADGDDSDKEDSKMAEYENKIASEMASSMKKYKATEEQTKECHALQAVANLNMSICFYKL